MNIKKTTVATIAVALSLSTAVPPVVAVECNPGRASVVDTDMHGAYHRITSGTGEFARAVATIEIEVPFVESGSETRTFIQLENDGGPDMIEAGVQYFSGTSGPGAAQVYLKWTTSDGIAGSISGGSLGNITSSPDGIRMYLTWANSDAGDNYDTWQVIIDDVLAIQRTFTTSDDGPNSLDRVYFATHTFNDGNQVPGRSADLQNFHSGNVYVKGRGYWNSFVPEHVVDHGAGVVTTVTRGVNTRDSNC